MAKFEHDGSSLPTKGDSSLLDLGLQRWQAVIKGLGATSDGSGQIYLPCPVHGGDKESAFSVGIGQDNWPQLTCHTRCADEIETDRKAWYAKARAKLVAAGVPADALVPTSGKPRRSRAPSGTTSPSAPRTKRAAKKPSTPPDPKKVDWWARQLRDEQADELAELRGLPVSWIRAAKVGWNGRRYTLPVWDVRTGELVDFTRYHPNPPGDEAKMMHRVGGTGRLYAPKGTGQELFDSSTLVVFCEGQWDTLVAKRRGFNAVGTTGGAGNVPAAELLEPLRGCKVVMVFDCDDAGVKGADKWARRLTHELGCDVRICDLGLPKGGDVSDFLRSGKSNTRFQKKLDAAEPWVEKEAGGHEKVIWASDFEQRRLSWLWAGYLPMGKLALLEGDPGLGKSTMWVDIVARVTTGAAFPGDHREREPRNVLVIAGEDDWHDTIIPRLKAAGADLARVLPMPLKHDEEGQLIPLKLPEALHRIRGLIKTHDIALLVIDPVMAYMGQEINTNNTASVMTALGPLVEVLQDTGAAGVLVRHLNKSGDMQALYRGGGSMAFIGAARSGLVVAKHPEKPGVVVLAQTKQNLSRDRQALTYSVQKLTDDDGLMDTYIEWGDVLDVTADELLRKPDARRHSPQRNEAMRWLRNELSGGPVPATELMATAEAEGLVWHTIRRAKDQMRDVRIVREIGADGKFIRSIWHLGVRDEWGHS